MNPLQLRTLAQAWRDNAQRNLDFGGEWGAGFNHGLRTCAIALEDTAKMMELSDAGVSPTERVAADE